ncbi:MAG: sulfotransferase [Planctomycetaceae bacterium]|nr:sulfotransferase [Planctomycetaceae bacterium]
MLVKYFGPGCLAGITATDWFRLLAANHFRIAPAYLGKCAFLTASSLVTSLFRPVENALYSRRCCELRCDPPVFILGCWRSGTTHLHNLLCLDDRFGFSNMYQTMYPHTFLTSESWLRPLLDLMTPGKRFMDNMDQGLREPHEDEMALAILSHRSNMLSWAFPKNAACYDRFLDFIEASESDRTAWKQSLDLFVRKVSLRTGRQLVLKSPNHTARVQLIRELYPDAKFIHIHRHPYDVYRSMCHMASKVQPVWGLQKMPPDDIPPMVVDTYARLYNAYLDQKHLIPAGHLFEIRYEDLIANPVHIVRQAYEQLQLGDFTDIEDKLTAYTQQQSSYQRNRHAELEPAARTVLHERWERFFQEFGYRQS